MAGGGLLCSRLHALKTGARVWNGCNWYFCENFTLLLVREWHQLSGMQSHKVNRIETSTDFMVIENPPTSQVIPTNWTFRCISSRMASQWTFCARCCQIDTVTGDNMTLFRRRFVFTGNISRSLTYVLNVIQRILLSIAWRQVGILLRSCPGRKRVWRWWRELNPLYFPPVTDFSEFSSMAQAET